MDISSEIINAIEQGQCTLFLGAGASQEAGAPSADKLSKALASKFLREKQWQMDLASTISLVIAVTGDRLAIEDFVNRELKDLEPSPYHLKIPWYPWRAIVTTNYDTLIEKAYEKEKGAFQEIDTIIRVEDLPRAGSMTSLYLPLLKPHGCISRPESMVLSLENIHEAKRDRRLLFTHIETLHVMGPVIYIGYSLKDIHILDMIYDLTKRLGQYRKPILFVTRQSKKSKALSEGKWIELTLKADYLAYSFKGFINRLCQQLQPAIGQSKIIPQMAPCRSYTFAGNGAASYTASHEFKTVDGEWECWLKYTIHHEGGYAGLVFERLGDPFDISGFKKVSFELNVPDTPRRQDLLEAFKLESYQMLCPYLLDVAELKGRGWIRVSVDLENYEVDKKRLSRVVLADNGHRAELGQEYRIGVRKVKFE